MKKLFLLLSPILLYGYTIDFQSALAKTEMMNKGLKAKKLNISLHKEGIKEAQSYSYGSIVFQENISKTNNAGYVFGMKLSSREATFADFGFDEFDMSGATDPLPVAPENLNYPKLRTNYETKITYKLPLFTGFKIQNGKKMAQLQVLASNALYQYDEKKLGLEVLKAYNGAVTAKEFIKATQKAQEATQSFVTLAQELYQEGLVTSIDVKQAQVYDMNMASTKIEAHNRYALALSYLRFLTDDQKITDVGVFHEIDSEILSLESLQKKASFLRDDLLSMEYNTKMMKTNIDLNNADFYPSIGAQIEYGYNDDSFNNINDDHDYYLGAIGLSYTLFDGLRSSAKKEKAKIEYKKTHYYYEQMKDGIDLEIEKNLLTLEAKEKILEQKTKAQSLSDEVLEQSQELYKNHLINMSNLLMQQANQQKANAAMIFAKYEKSLAQATLQISLGEQLQ